MNAPETPPGPGRDRRPPPPADPHAGPGERGRGYIPTLDGWRAVAILWVMTFHDGRQLFGPSGLLPSPALYRVAGAGHYGVDIFFSLSGFLICSRLLDERRATGRVDLPGFYIRRCFRIMPPYYTFLAVLGLLWAAGAVAADAREYLMSLTFLRNYYGRVGGWFTSHFWSLAVEEHFYLIWPGLLVLLATSRRALWAALGLGLAIRAWRAIDLRFALGARYLGLPIIGADQRTDVCLDGLFFGCALALVVADGRGRARLARLVNPYVWPALLAAFLVLALGLARPPGGGHLIAAAIPLMIAGTVLHPRSAASRLLEWGPARAVGRLSYSLYLWQPFLGTIAIGAWASAAFSRASTPAIQRFPLNWLACFAVALLSYRLVERPAIALGRRIASRREARGGIAGVRPTAAGRASGAPGPGRSS